MIRRLSSFAVTSSFVGVLVLTNSSCASLHANGTSSNEPARGAQGHTRQRLVQLYFGRDAAFGVCVEPACPQLTPKTLAAAGPVIQPIALRPQQEFQASAQTVAAEAVPPARPSPVVEQPPPPVPAEVATHHVVVNFPFASAELTAPTKASLSASVEHARTAERIVISGRTDVVGNDKVNEALAFTRALAVRNYFRDVAPDIAAAISIDARGRCCFIASNQDEGGRSKNRRVEIVFTSRRGA